MSKNEYDTAPLTEAEENLLKRPLKELRELGLVPGALEALDRKHAINRAENEIERASERDRDRLRDPEEYKHAN